MREDDRKKLEVGIKKGREKWGTEIEIGRRRWSRRGKERHLLGQMPLILDGALITD